MDFSFIIESWVYLSITLPAVLIDDNGKPWPNPEDTNLIPWFDFIKVASFKNPKVFFMFAAVAVLSMAIGYILTPVAVFWAGLAVMGYYAVFIDNYSTRRMLVFRQGSSDEIYLDEQKWWKDTAEIWPDGSKYLHRNKRVGVWEDTGAGLRPFDCWAAPISEDGAEGSDVGNIGALQEAGRKVVRFQEAGTFEQIKLGMFALIIGGMLMATIMAAGQITDITSGVENDPIPGNTTEVVGTGGGEDNAGLPGDGAVR